MYTYEKLKKYNFAKNRKLEVLLDPLTGVVRREFIVEYVEELIKNDIPFSYSIYDIDNFKLINDNYGHHIGDDLLKTIGERMVAKIDNALVGRFGGDEFLIVSTEHSTYEPVWKFVKHIYENVFRYKTDIIEDSDLLITCTSGTSMYPNHGKTMDEIFLKADKALYRGKAKGRNCFIIYVEEKHANIDITKLNRTITIHKIIENVNEVLVNKNYLKKRIINTFEFLCNSMSLTEIYLVKDEEEIYSYHSRAPKPSLIEELIEPIFENEKMIVVNNLSNLLMTYPKTHDHCFRNQIKSFIAIKVAAYGKEFGTLVFQDSNIKRVWQNEDRAVFSHLANMISLMLYYEK